MFCKYQMKLPVLALSMAVIILSVSTAFAQQTNKEACTDGISCPEPEEAPQYGLTEAEIAEFTVPDYRQLTVNTDLLNDRRYMQVSATVPILDAPNGNVIRYLDAGFNFFTVLNVQSDWVEINRGEWVARQYLSDTNYVISRFTGIFLPDEFPEYQPAWMLVNAYPSREPGGNPRESNGLHYRYTQVHIYDTAYDEEGWRWYQIGPGKWVHQTTLAKVEPVERPEEVDTARWVGIDLYEQVLIVYEDDKPIFATLISSGLPRWPTFEGIFNIYYRRVRHDMSWGTPGDDFYYLEEVPWTMFFDEGRALHGAYWHDGLGYRRSHGCVNMSITDAHWLYTWVAEEFEKFNSPDVETGPAVYVYSSDEYRG